MIAKRPCRFCGATDFVLGPGPGEVPRHSQDLNDYRRLTCRSCLRIDRWIKKGEAELGELPIVEWVPEPQPIGQADLFGGRHD